MKSLGENYDVWIEGIERPTLPDSGMPLETDYVVIGGGMAGVVSAYKLAKAGKKVVLFEKKKLGGYVTEATTGFLTSTIDTEPQTLIRKFGKEKARLILESHTKAIAEVEHIAREENIDCDFRRVTNYIYANNTKEEKHLQKLARAYKDLGIEAEYKKGGIFGFNKLGCIAMANHAVFHPEKYLFALAERAMRAGATILENTEVLAVKDSGTFCTVETALGVLRADTVISATYRPFGKPKDLWKLANMYTEYVVEYEVPKNMFLPGTYEDTRDPYNYFRIDPHETHDRLMIGGADHLSVIKPDPILGTNAMRRYAEELFGKEHLSEKRYWSGSMLQPRDGLPFIGPHKDGNIFYITAFSGNGMTYSHIASGILMDHLSNTANPYANIYATDRKISFWKNLFS